MLTYSRYRKIDYSGLLGAFVASWTLHAAMFVVFESTRIYYPLTADREIISVDLFFAEPASTNLTTQTERENATVRSQALSVNKETGEYDSEDIAALQGLPHQGALELMTLPAQTADLKKLSVAKTTARTVTASKNLNEQKPPPSATVIAPENTDKTEAGSGEPEKTATREVEAQSGLEMEAKTLELSEQERKAADNEKIRRLQEVTEEKERTAAERLAAETARAAELERLESEKTDRMKREADQAKAEREKARLEQIARLKKEEQKQAVAKQARERAAAEKNAKTKADQARPSRTELRNDSTAPARQSSAEGKPVSSVNTVTASAVSPEKPLASKPVDSGNNQLEKIAERKGLALPPVTGDIKLILTSEDEVTIKIIFISYPKARHNKPISRNEAKEQQKLKPIVVRRAKSTLEAVIEQSGEGIYIFLVEQKGMKPAKGQFSLRLFESRDKPLPNREISGQTEVARLMMPEGILWEDDTAFSGNIEDSESITKFNSDTGLIWKEYRN